MKQWLKRSVIVMVIACIFLGSSQKVRAEGTLIPPELEEKYFGTSSGDNYDVGSSIRGGTFELRSDSNSLKVGDTVAVQIFFNADKAGFDLDAVIMQLYYDKDILQYIDTTLGDEYKNDYGGSIIDASENGQSIQVYVETPISTSYDKYGCIATVQFRVKQGVASATVYGGEIDSSGIDGAYHYLSDSDPGFKYMSLTVTDTSSPTPTPDPVPAGTLEFADGTVEGNGDITVPISIKSNDGFAALGLTVTYDAALFDYTGLEVDSSLESDVAVKSIDLISDGEIRAAFVAGRDITSTGNFLNLKLKVKDGVAAGTSSTVGVAVTQAANYDTASLNGTGASYTVTVKEEGGGDIDNPEPSGQKLGDVDNNGTIDLVDALYILQNYNNVRELSAAEKTAADVDKDGDVDLVDALNILKYYNGVITGF